MLFFSSFSITAIIIVALSNKNSDIKIEKIIDRPAILFKDLPEDTPY
ncbi:hypothetical protein [Clostridium sp. 001]|nr:hypothetical protein [Clostridium sp. 001]